MAIPAENRDNQDILEKKPEEKQQKKAENIDKSKLTPTELKNLEDGKTTVEEIVREREQYKKAAEAELNELVTVTQDDENIIELKEYKAIKTQLNDIESAEKMKELLDKIRDIPNQKQKEQKKEKEDSTPLPPEDPKLLKLQKKFNDTCDENIHLIGEGQIDGFKAWFAKERQKNPTIKHLNEQIQKLEGKTYYDSKGLGPRRVEYAKLQRLFKRHKISSPLDSDYIKREGHSERKQFRKNAEDLEEHLEKASQTGFYSREVLQELMKDVLTSKSLADQKTLYIKAKTISRKESETFTYLDEKMQVGGTTIRKMSEASKKTYLDYYKNTKLKERENLVTNWRKLVENESDLARKLEDIYKDKPELLKKALGSFEELDFIKKQKALDEHKKLLEKEKDKEKLEELLTIKAAQAKIGSAANKNIISSSTKDNWKSWFNSEKALHDPETGKKTGLEALKKHYEILVSETPSAEHKNIKAYEIKRNRFRKESKELLLINPDFKKEDYEKFLTDYDNETWTGRKRVYKELVSIIEKERSDMRKKRELKAKAGVKTENKEGTETLETRKIIETAQELMNDGQNKEAFKFLTAFWLENEQELTESQNREIRFWISVASDKIDKFGDGEKLEDTLEEDIEKELDNLSKSDEEIKDELEEQNIITLNIEGARQSEELHEKKVSAQDRAKDESFSDTKNSILERDLTRDFYEQTDKDHILNDEGRGELIKEIEISNIGLTEEERIDAKEGIKGDMGRLYDRKGFIIKLKDKDQRDTSVNEAEARQEEVIETLEQDMAEKAEEKVIKKNGTQTFDLNAKIAARRKARELIDKDRHSKEKLRKSS
ncbi:MAG: hypothetical protein V1679_01350 [Candidatus Peregrinibacteria bacterium]